MYGGTRCWRCRITHAGRALYTPYPNAIAGRYVLALLMLTFYYNRAATGAWLPFLPHPHHPNPPPTAALCFPSGTGPLAGALLHCTPATRAFSCTVYAVAAFIAYTTPTTFIPLYRTGSFAHTLPTAHHAPHATAYICGVGSLVTFFTQPFIYFVVIVRRSVQRHCRTAHTTYPYDLPGCPRLTCPTLHLPSRAARSFSSFAFARVDAACPIAQRCAATFAFLAPFPTTTYLPTTIATYATCLPPRRRYHKSTPLWFISVLTYPSFSPRRCCSASLPPPPAFAFPTFISRGGFPLLVYFTYALYRLRHYLYNNTAILFYL